MYTGTIVLGEFSELQYIPCLPVIKPRGFLLFLSMRYVGHEHKSK